MDLQGDGLTVLRAVEHAPGDVEPEWWDKQQRDRAHEPERQHGAGVVVEQAVVRARRAVSQVCIGQTKEQIVVNFP